MATRSSRSKKTTHWAAIGGGVTVVLGLITAILAFAGQLFDSSKPPPPASLAAVAAPAPVSAPDTGAQQIVVHRSGTTPDTVLSGHDDHTITTADMQNEPYAMAGYDAYAANELGAVFFEYCAPKVFRVANAHDRSVLVLVGERESENVSMINLGPGERWASQPMPAGDYIVLDEEKRWASAFNVVDCGLTASDLGPESYEKK